MDQDQREQEIFKAALELGTPEARRGFVLGACGPDQNLQEKVEALLSAHFADQSYIPTGYSPPTAPRESTTGPSEGPGTVLGRYKLLQKIGEGGSGVVYMAEQVEPVRRRVALKIIKLGMDTKQVIARFEAERQALALMDHPNIARVLDAGATESGRPYFVMELVHGIKITEYCDQNRLPAQERLELFMQVCHAIQHAHQKGVIHRDIKPSNILVCVRDGVPVPVVIDFGIAKATERPLTDKTLVTGFEQFIGTPAYMSPEQAEVSRLDIDTRSDIYSLGVLLYELLTAKTPFDSAELLAQGVDGMRRTIREQEPLRPSTRLGRMKSEELTAVAQHRRTEPPRLLSLVRGDLDWIAMKCLEKDRTRRYETANELARDIRRHMTHELVVARPPTTAYKVRKFVGRNKVVVSAGIVVAAALVLGILASTWQAVRARRAERTAVQAQVSEGEARRTAEQGLYRSLLGEARAKRLSRLVGYREEVFKLVRQARALNIPERNLAELRQEAVACLGDFVGLTNLTWEFPQNISGGAWHPNGGMSANFMSDGSLVLREVPSGKELGRSQIEPGIGGLRFSPSGDRLVLVRWPYEAQSLQDKVRGSVVFVWDVTAQGRCSEPEKLVVPGAVRCFASNKGLRLVILDPAAGSVKLVDLDARTVLHESKFSKDWQNWSAQPILDLSPDERLVATISAEPTGQTQSEVDIWDVQSSRLLHKLTPRLSICNGLMFSRDGTHLAATCDAGIAVYDMKTFERVAFTKETVAGPTWVSFAPDTERSLIAINLSQQHQIRIWDYIKNVDAALLNLAHEAGGHSFGPDGKFLRATGRQMRRINYYRLTVPEKLTLAGHSATVPGIAFSPDGMRLASVGKDHTLKVWDTSNGTLEWRGQLPGPGQGVSYSPEGRLLAATDSDMLRVSIWDAGAGKVLFELGTNVPGSMWSAQFSSDGRYLATAGCCKSFPYVGPTDPNPGVTVWELVPSVPGQPQAGLEAKPAKAFAGQCLSLFFTPGAHRLEFIDWAVKFVDWDAWTRSNRMDLYSWDIGATDNLRLLTRDREFTPIDSSSLRAACLFSVTPDGNQLMFAGTNGAIVTLDIATGRQLASFPTTTPGETRELDPLGQFTNARELRLSPDGTKLALTSRSTLGVDVWDPKHQRLLYDLPEQKSTVYCMAWSPDSRRLAISRASGDIEIWDLLEVERVLAALGLEPEQP